MSYKPDFTKGGADAELRGGDRTVATDIEIVIEWMEPEPTGRAARLVARFGKGVDVDGAAIYYVGDEPMGYVSPKSRSVLGGCLTHGGNVKRGGGEDKGEKITINLGDIRDVDDDVDGIAVTASCASGNFDGVSEAYCRIWNITGGQRTQLGVVRVPIRGTHTGVVIGVLKKGPEAWRFNKLTGVRGDARTWTQLGDLAKRHVASAS